MSTNVCVKWIQTDLSRTFIVHDLHGCVHFTRTFFNFHRPRFKFCYVGRCFALLHIMVLVPLERGEPVRQGSKQSLHFRRGEPLKSDAEKHLGGAVIGASLKSPHFNKKTPSPTWAQTVPTARAHPLQCRSDGLPKTTRKSWRPNVCCAQTALSQARIHGSQSQASSAKVCTITCANHAQQKFVRFTKTIAPRAFLRPGLFQCARKVGTDTMQQRLVGACANKGNEWRCA